MANGERCKHCGQQETAHEKEYRESMGACESFESTADHDPSCPIIGCTQDCATTIRNAERDHARQQAEWGKFGG